MATRYKPKVVISQRFSPFMETADAVSNACEEGAADDPQLSLFFNEFEELDPDLPTINALYSSQLAAAEASQSALELRNVAFATLKDAIVRVRDMALAAHSDNPSAIGVYGFEVRQTRTSGTRSRPKVVIPVNPDQFIAMVDRVRLAVDDAAVAGVAVAVSMKVVLDDPAVSSARTSAVNNNRLRLSKSEEAQRIRAERLAGVEKVRALLARVRDYGYGKFGPGNYEQISTLGFEVQSSKSENRRAGRPSGSLGVVKRRGVFENIRSSRCNVNGVIDTACIALVFGTESPEYEAVEATDGDGSGTVQILDVAVTLGLLDPNVESTEPSGSSGSFGDVITP